MTEKPNPQVIEATQKAVADIEANIYERRMGVMLEVMALAVLGGPVAKVVGKFDQFAAWLDRLTNEGYSR